MEGVEPTHPYGYQILSLARLPIPPHRLPTMKLVLRWFALGSVLITLPLTCLRSNQTARAQTKPPAKTSESLSHIDMACSLTPVLAGSLGNVLPLRP